MIFFYFEKKILTIIFYFIEDVFGKKDLLDDLMNIYFLIFYHAIIETVSTSYIFFYSFYFYKNK